jgi:hypothetical protein
MAIKNDADLAYKLVDVMGLLLSITKEVYAPIKFSKRKKKDFNEDMFTLCTVAVDNGIINIVSGLLALTETTKESKLILGSDGSIAMEAQTLIQAVTATQTEVKTPTLALQQFSLITKVAGLSPQFVGLGRDIASLVMKGINSRKTKPKEWEEL